MEQPVRLSDELVNEARVTAAISLRSTEGQIEFWAQLGRSLEPLLRGDRALTLQQSGSVKSLADAVREVDSPEGLGRTKEYLSTRPYPHFEAIQDQPGLLRRIEADGTTTIGRFVNRDFEPVDP